MASPRATLTFTILSCGVLSLLLDVNFGQKTVFGWTFGGFDILFGALLQTLLVDLIVVRGDNSIRSSGCKF